MTRREKAEIARQTFESFQAKTPKKDIILILPENDKSAHLTALQKVVKEWPEK